MILVSLGVFMFSAIQMPFTLPVYRVPDISIPLPGGSLSFDSPVMPSTRYQSLYAQYENLAGTFCEVIKKNKLDGEQLTVTVPPIDGSWWG